jgi:uncharacterized Ntn-hydrolase superfamily protein
VTFSISGRCGRTGEFGIAVSSSSPAVAARCAHARSGAGVVAAQNITDPRLGQRGLDLLAEGLSPEAVLARLREGNPHIEHRQLVVVGRAGPAAVFSGSGALGVHAAAVGADCAAAGNLLASPQVPRRMVEAFEADPAAPLGDRLVAAMRAGVAAGGEAGPVHSAGMLVVRDLPWPVADLRVDWTESGDPIEALAALWELWKPQQEDYVRRALDPGAAPAFGVPGDP